MRGPYGTPPAPPPDGKEALASGERMVFGPLVVELDGFVLNGQMFRGITSRGSTGLPLLA